MVNVSKMLTILGCFLILFAILLKLVNADFAVGTMKASLLSLLVMANASFLLAIISKK